MLKLVLSHSLSLQNSHVTLDLGLLEAAANETLGGKQRVLGVGDGLQGGEREKREERER